MCASVCASVHTFKHEYLRSQPPGHSEILSETSDWGGGKPALGLGSDRIRTLVSIAVDSSHRLIMGETVVTFSQLF